MFHVKQFEILKDFANKNGIVLNERQLDQFALLCSVLLDGNRSVNLTAIRDPEEVEIRHFADSIATAPLISGLVNNREDFSLIDVGTGGGFPGLPLKIVFSEARFTLLDSIKKKTDFVRRAAELLELDKVEVVNGRAEDLAGTGGVSRETYDICVSRAVANTATLSEYCLPFVKPGGAAIFYKAGNISDELKEAATAISVLGGEILSIKSHILPGDAAERSLVVIKKTGRTPEKYPRRSGKPGKSPIR